MTKYYPPQTAEHYCLRRPLTTAFGCKTCYITGVNALQTTFHVDFNQCLKSDICDLRETI